MIQLPKVEESELVDLEYALVALSDGDFNPLQPLAPLVEGVNLVDSVP